MSCTNPEKAGYGAFKELEQRLHSAARFLGTPAVELFMSEHYVKEHFDKAPGVIGGAIARPVYYPSGDIQAAYEQDLSESHVEAATDAIIGREVALGHLDIESAFDPLTYSEVADSLRFGEGL